MCVDYTSLNKGMPKGCFPSSMHQPGRGPHCQVLTPEFSRCLLELSPDPSRQGGLACHQVHHSLRMLLLRKDAFQVKEHVAHLPAVHAILF
jgi:hypothetical protein